MAESMVTIRSGARLLDEMTTKGLTQAALARAVGVSYQRIGQLITESYPNLRASTAAAIEDHLALARGTLFTPQPLSNADLYGETRGSARDVPNADIAPRSIEPDVQPAQPSGESQQES